MGVPGDMNLELLDYINDVDGLSWGKSDAPLCLDLMKQIPDRSW